MHNRPTFVAVGNGRVGLWHRPPSVGFRVNHHLNLHVSTLAVESLSGR